jgi:hypothetical protein
MKSPVKTILQALLFVILFLPVYYTFAARSPYVTELNKGSHHDLNIHDNKTPVHENNPCNDTDLKNPVSTDIEDLFVWSGWAFNAILDTNNDEIIDTKDIPLTYDFIENKGNSNGIIDDNEFNNWLSDAEYVGLAKFYKNERISDISDPVVTGQSGTVTIYSAEI